MNGTLVFIPKTDRELAYVLTSPNHPLYRQQAQRHDNGSRQRHFARHIITARRRILNHDASCSDPLAKKNAGPLDHFFAPNV